MVEMADTARVAVEVEMRRTAAAGNRGVLWTLQIGDITVRGTTQTEAKERMAAAIAAGVRGDYTPCRIALEDHEALVWREPCGWRYEVRRVSDAPERTGYRSSGAGADREECLHAAMRDMAQRVDGALIRAGREPVGEQVLTREADRETHRAWCRWQQGYHAGKGAGLSDQHCRVVADMWRAGSDRPGDVVHFCRLEGVPVFDVPAELLQRRGS